MFLDILDNGEFVLCIVFVVFVGICVCAVLCIYGVYAGVCVCVNVYGVQCCVCLYVYVL